MPDAISSTELILLTAILGMLLLLALILTRISNNLARVSKQLHSVTNRMEGPPPEGLDPFVENLPVPHDAGGDPAAQIHLALIDQAAQAQRHGFFVAGE